MQTCYFCSLWEGARSNLLKDLDHSAPQTASYLIPRLRYFRLSLPLLLSLSVSGRLERCYPFRPSILKYPILSVAHAFAPRTVLERAGEQQRGQRREGVDTEIVITNSSERGAVDGGERCSRGALFHAKARVQAVPDDLASLGESRPNRFCSGNFFPPGPVRSFCVVCRGADIKSQA